MRRAGSADPMQKAKAAESTPRPEGETTAHDVEAYLASVPEPALSTLKKVRAVIRSAAPAEATECLSYGIPAFRYKGALVGYAAFKEQCSLFPMSAALIEALKDDLEGYSLSKGTIRFAVDKPLPAGLIKKLVKARVTQNELKKSR
jgi:uncharacterized protein YdhG (YjbR/CyaY superfamily)